jgi:Flp pilus assembly pilin Flp
MWLSSYQFVRNLPWLIMWKREEGQDLVEYALVIALIALAVTASTSSLAIVLTTAMNTVADGIVNAIASN